jgi:hypothetical protein
MQWNPTIFENLPEGTGTTYTVRWQRSDADFLASHAAAFRIGETTNAYIQPLVRFICHVLVDQVPDRGLQELLESLTDIYEFYATLPEKKPLALPESEPIKARVTGSVIRPVYPVSEEEE